MAPHRNPPLLPRIQQHKTAGANSKLDKTWGQGQ
jgi:putative transposase